MTLGRRLLEHPISGEEIERRSFEEIEREGVRGGLTDDEWTVARRLVHATGDPALVKALRFQGSWKRAGMDALHAGEPIYCDASMARAGISAERLRGAGGAPSDLRCEVADREVGILARDSGLPRSVLAVRKVVSSMGSGGIWLFGNAPTGLMELVRLHREEGYMPSLVLAMPVGFVHVVESLSLIHI